MKITANNKLHFTVSNAWFWRQHLCAPQVSLDVMVHREKWMNTSKHIKIAGVLQLVHGLPFLLGGILYTFALIYDLQAGKHEWNESWGDFLILAVLIFLGVCQVCFGVSLTMQKQWATRIAGFICCAIGLPVIPVGTAISGYTLWVLLQVKNIEEKTAEPVEWALTIGRKMEGQKNEWRIKCLFQWVLN